MDELILPAIETRLGWQYFAKHADEVAKDLLGRVLVFERHDAGTLYARIHEVAAYEGEVDSMTGGALYGPGTLAVSTKHGKRMLDVATLNFCEPSCVTLIAAEVYNRQGYREFIQGPGNLGKALEITPELDAYPLDMGGHIWVGGEAIDATAILMREKKNVAKNCQGYFYFK